MTLVVGDCRATLARWAAEGVRVQCVVTSPPYWGLRDYGLPPLVWDGDPACPHEWGEGGTTRTGRNDTGRQFFPGHTGNYKEIGPAGGDTSTGATCHRCGAWRGSLGLEPTPELYVAHIVEVFRLVRDVLADDGTLWLNLGDSYSGYHGNGRVPDAEAPSNKPGYVENMRATTVGVSGLKPKDLVGIPWAVAKALQAPYYTGRIKDVGDRRWMAAMIDGEGTICGFRHERPDGNIRTGILVFITNGNEDLLSECDRIWPGARYIDTLKTGDVVLGAVARHDCWRWQIQKAEERQLFLREIYPYLIAKRRQALVALAMLDFTLSAKTMGRGGEDSETKEKRDVLARVLSDLNQRRPVDLPSWIKEPPSLYEPGYYLRSDIIWSKNNPMPESVTDRPTKAHEYLFLLSKRATYYYDWKAIKEPFADGRMGADYPRPNAPDAIKSPYGQGFTRRASERNRGGRTDGFTKPNNIDPSANGGRNRRSVWTIPTAPYPEAHFATFPPGLVTPCILAGSRPGDTVLDPFMGAGTVAMVAQDLGRRWLGCELNPAYANLGERRTRQQGLML